MKPTLVFDNIVNPEDQDKIEAQILGGDWKFVDDMSYNKSKFPSYGLNQMFKHPTYGVLSPAYESICVPIINSLISAIENYDVNNFQVKDIAHSRAFLQLPLNEKFVKEHNGVHIDMPIEHYAVVYYCNDADGDTILYEQTMKNTPMGAKDVKLVEHKRVTPKKGRIVMFDGFRYHCSTQPRDNRRMIINFNLV
jgi:hypothetical protein